MDPTRRLALLTVSIGLCAGCAGSSSPAVQPTHPAAPRTASVSPSAPVTPADREATMTGLRRFGLELLAAAGRDGAQDNTCVSPVSVGAALAMLRAGAKGATAAEIDAALHEPDGLTTTAWPDLLNRLPATSTAPPSDPSHKPDTSQQPAPSTFTVVNGLFTQDGYPVQPSYVAGLTSSYRAQWKKLDFSKPSATGILNDWVNTNTAGRIRKLFDQLDPATKVVLANAVFLKGWWANPFNQAETRDEPFTTGASQRTEVPMMHGRLMSRYAEGPGWQAVELPFIDRKLSVDVVVPATGGDPQVALRSALTAAPWKDGVDVDLSLPRWKFSTDLDLTPVLAKLGVTTAFGAAADFSGIAPGLFVSQAVHRTTVAVDEEGAEASAVTAFSVATGAMQPAGHAVVRADHPFAFAIVDPTTRATVFLGVVNDPTAS